MKSTNVKKSRSVLLEMNNTIALVVENQRGYTNRQFEQAKRARKLYHAVGGPTVENFKHLIRQNLIQDCPVMTKDVDITEKIFGPDIGTLKG